MTIQTAIRQARIHAERSGNPVIVAEFGSRGFEIFSTWIPARERVVATIHPRKEGKPE